MKFEELFEMPEYLDKELTLPPNTLNVISSDSLNREYTLLGRHQSDGNLIVSAIKSDQSSAVIGMVVTRDDGVRALKVVVVCDFHLSPNLGELPAVPALQVDTVQSLSDMKGFGYGYQLYKDLLDSGITVVSDHTQYRGGKALWMKIVKRAARDMHNVFILRDGKLLRDENNEVVMYDGSNVSDDVIWGKAGSLQHFNTLLVARSAEK